MSGKPEEINEISRPKLARCHKSACDLNFDRQTYSDLDEIWLKNQAWYEDALARIWGQSDLLAIFPIFGRFRPLGVFWWGILVQCE